MIKAILVFLAAIGGGVLGVAYFHFQGYQVFVIPVGVILLGWAALRK